MKTPTCENKSCRNKAVVYQTTSKPRRWLCTQCAEIKWGRRWRMAGIHTADTIIAEVFYQ